jgi:hypothetical protein
VTELVQQLLSNGTAVLSPEMKHCLQFYRRCHQGVYPYTPPHIQLAFDSSTELQPFWDCLQLAVFKSNKGIGLQMVTRLLQTYCVFNLPIGYLQGMNDLFVPILLAFLPEWGENGEPRDADGQVLDFLPFLPVIF